MTGPALLDQTQRPHVSGNDSDLPRDAVMRQARHDVHELAKRGLSCMEIELRFERKSLNHTERGLLWLIATHEVDRARR